MGSAALDLNKTCFEWSLGFRKDPLWRMRSNSGCQYKQRHMVCKLLIYRTEGKSQQRHVLFFSKNGPISVSKIVSSCLAFNENYSLKAVQCANEDAPPPPPTNPSWNRSLLKKTNSNVYANSPKDFFSSHTWSQWLWSGAFRLQKNKAIVWVLKTWNIAHV